MRAVKKVIVVFVLCLHRIFNIMKKEYEKSFLKGPLASVGRAPLHNTRSFLSLRFDSCQIRAVGGDELPLLPAPDGVDTSLRQVRCSAQTCSGLQKKFLCVSRNRVRLSFGWIAGWLTARCRQSIFLRLAEQSNSCY